MNLGLETRISVGSYEVCGTAKSMSRNTSHANVTMKYEIHFQEIHLLSLSSEEGGK